MSKLPSTGFKLPICGFGMGDFGPQSTTNEPDKVETKIELASVYVEMGDIDGARELLEEAAREGTETEVETARTLLMTLETR